MLRAGGCTRGFNHRSSRRANINEIKFVIPNDGPVSWVASDDLSEGAAKILQNFLGKTLNLTGPRTASVSDIAKLVEQHTGRKVSVEIVGRQEAERYHKHEKKSVPEGKFWVVESMTGLQRERWPQWIHCWAIYWEKASRY